MKKNEFEARFSPEITEIAAVIAPSGCGAGRGGGETYWSVNAEITAWQHVEGGEVHVADCCRLTALVENTDELREKLKANSVITAKVRKGGKDFLICEITESGKSFPLLEQVLEEQLKPVYYEDGVLGTFTLDKSINTYDGTVDWLGEEISVSFNLDEEENMRSSISLLRNLTANQKDWDVKARQFAASALTDLANEWLQEEDEEEITEEDFASRITLNEITAETDGEFIFWFDDDDIFLGHSICVTGTIENGFDDAEIAG